jgi:hypothetical protein
VMLPIAFAEKVHCPRGPQILSWLCLLSHQAVFGIVLSRHIS